MPFLNLRESVSRNHEQVGQSIVVEVHHAGAPADEAIFHRQPGSPAGFFEIGLAHVVVEVWCIAFEVCFEDIHVAIEVIIAYAHPHSSLFHAIIAKSNSAEHTFLAKGAIVIVQKQ